MTIKAKKSKINLREKLAELLNFRQIRDRLDGLGLYLGKDRTGTTENLAVRGGENVDDLQLAEISAALGGTAVDVFVYDTRNDSDGGKWRERTSHTSWYNEELNTATRGGRREFPAVAVIVAEAGKVTIYDGDDPDLSMWMVFDDDNAGADVTYVGVGNNIQAVSALNGRMSVGCSIYGIFTTNFIADECIRVNTTYFFSLTENTAGRNNTSGLIHLGGDPIVNASVNDVAMTVLPNSTIDSETGLPVPTIAVATDGGVSVIKDDGSVVDSASNYNTTPSRTIVFDNQNRLIITLKNFENIRFFDDYLVENFIGYEYWYGSPSRPAGEVPLSLGHNSTYSAITEQDAYGNILGLSKHNISKGDTDSSFCYITSTYNTGWMPGDIKLATLSDTKIEKVGVDETELVANGKFDTDSDWTKGTGWSISEEVATHDASLGAGDLDQSLDLIVGKSYTIILEITNSDATEFYFKTDDGDYVAIEGSPVGTHAYTFVADKASQNVGVRGSANWDGSINNISVRLAEPDRSVNNNGLQIFGEIEKTPVATGADLVAYGGFSADDYLMQPYNSDLDFGTGDFCMMAWIKDFAIDGDYQRIFSRGIDGNTGVEWDLYFHTSSPHFRFRYYVDGISQGDTYFANISSMSTDSWNQIVFSRKDDLVQMHINGSKVYSNPFQFGPADLTNTNARLYVGNRFTPSDNLAFNGSIALARISATAPTDEQIAKIYRDEKVLFQDGAQVTLYGTSDAVTALAYDDSDNLLHVGTASGRSSFNGLKRVDNTTTAVSTAISATEGLVIEQ